MKLSNNFPMTMGMNQTRNLPKWHERCVVRLLETILSDCHGSLKLQMPSGYTHSFGGNNVYAKKNSTQTTKAVVVLHTLKPLLKLMTSGANGWADAYIDAQWDSPNLLEVINWALKNEQALKRTTKARFLTSLPHKFYHRANNNTKKGSRKNISAHYDLGNEFFSEWLDSSMTYSAALFKHSNQTLEQAQREKYQRILELLDPRDRDKIIEIGCGWGEFAAQAAKSRNVHVQGITLSNQQLLWGKEKLHREGLQNKTQLQLMDYRDISRQYDGAVSIEMFEAVGEKHWDSYFRKLKGILKPGAKAVLQIITIEDERFYSYRKTPDFIQRYVFPGGMLPSVEQLKQKFSQHGFTLEHQQMFGMDYAKTVSIWRQRFEEQWSNIAQQGFDHRFYRLWSYYLAYCQSGFEQETIDVGLFVLKQNQPHSNINPGRPCDI